MRRLKLVIYGLHCQYLLLRIKFSFEFVACMVFGGFWCFSSARCRVTILEELVEDQGRVVRSGWKALIPGEVRLRTYYGIYPVLALIFPRNRTTGPDIVLSDFR